ncbi:Riboflavin transporter FmnP [Amphibacillus marinus]|uniref:Riboflavin transporter n=1 Tax=Amphibacillus marinus TaxID=872970 RepID=A0A1H8S124_9BACI|nr:ECF transporter S component [Amphibacillus marinus]SEO72292.1 Riboflavin transporter FmnP [Amphibacillus marinus]
MKKTSSNLTKLIILSLFGTISMVLLFLNFPLPFLPPYLKVDFGEVPTLLAALIFSPMAGVIVQLIKNVLYLLFTGAADPVGVFANFVAGVSFVVPIAMVYHRFKGNKSLVSGLVTGTIIMTIAMGFLNFYVLLPIYSGIMGWEMSDTAMLSAIFAGVVPFNIVKSIIVSILFIPLFVKLKPWIKQKQTAFN